MSKPTANLRLFVGVYPPREIAERLVAGLHRLKLPPHRFTPLPQVHMTLQFIGDTPSRQLDATIESVQRATGGLSGFSLTPLRLITLPNRRGAAARLVAAETDAPPTLLELQRRLAGRLARNARKRPGDRFLPHLTLCRFRSPARIPPLEHDLDLPGFAVEQLRLMRSELKPTGAVHEEVIVCPLSRS
ncbi:MAG: RNA 2',3'-cyclic phosphodiesterase [Phycisphaerales bacterium]|nr:MAG: RNA 2',3'-cyclic phosphodiesterase [Phycisphaerales bacterium]